MTRNVQSAEHEALARHTATQGPMQGAVERRELRDASCSEHAHVGLAELVALTVMNPPFLVLSTMSCGLDTEVSHQMQSDEMQRRPWPQSVPAGSHVAIGRDSPTLDIVDFGSV